MEQLLRKLTIAGSHVPKDKGVLLVTDTALIWMGPKKTRVDQVAEKEQWMAHLEFSRGNILEWFATFETIVSEMIKLRIAGTDPEKSLLAEDVLESVDLFSRLRILNEWQLISDKTYGSLQELKRVRNGLAHEWDLNDVTFRGKPIKNNFQAFRKTIRKAWQDLLAAYKEEQKIIDIDELIRSFEPKKV